MTLVDAGDASAGVADVVPTVQYQGDPNGPVLDGRITDQIAKTLTDDESRGP